MTPERWAQIEELFHRAAECELKQRIDLLDEACSNDPELRREVEVLLSCDGKADDYVQAAVRSELTAVGFPLKGETISHYRVLDGVGGGGMGLVYRAEDIRLGRQVALKFLPEESAKDSVALGRFEREARAASALEHPNICPIYEFGEHDGQPFLVMQLLEGRTLGGLISAPAHGKSPLDLNKLVDLAIQITEGLNAAHNQGIIHRDIKPANIFVTRQGQAKILDFGLAKLTRALTAAEDDLEWDPHGDGDVDILPPEIMPTSDADPVLSRTGVAMGTVGYMSPEQVRGEKLDGRTDLFSLGSVLYEMATGRRTFMGETWPVLRNALLNQIPSPARQLNPELPAKLERIISRALEKDREARYQSASEMLADLRTLKGEMEASSAPRWWALVSGTAVVLLIVGTILWYARHQPSPQTLPELKLQQLTINSSENPVTGGAISPDGKYFAYTDAKGMHIKLVGTDNTQTVPRPGTLKNGQANWEIVPTAWFSDSKQFIANAHPSTENQSAWSSRTSSIWKVSVLGGAPSKLRDNAVAWSVSPNDSSISFGTNESKLGPRELWMMGPSGDQARKLYAAGEKNAICCLHFFPNGQRVSYITVDESGDTLIARDLKGGPVATLLPPSEVKKMGDGTWLPDGRLIYSEPCNGAIMRPDTPCNYWITRLDTRSGGIIEKPRQLTNWVGLWLNSPSATVDGKRIAFLESSGRGTGYVADLEAGGTRLINPRHFTLDEADDAVLDWTADSKTVILSSNRGDHYGLYKQSLNSDTPEPIVTGGAGGLLETARVSPDGKWVTAQVWPITGGPTVKLVRVPITGGSPELIFSVREGSLSFCAKPPSNLCAVAEQTEDRKQMIVTAFDAVNGRGRELARFDLDPNYDTNVNNLLVDISSDGTRLVAARGPGGPIQIRSLRGQATRVIRARGLNNMELLQWAADGKGLFVSNVKKGGSEVLHVNLQGNARLLWKCSGDRCFGLPSPDGRHLAISEGRLSANMWMMENF